MKKILLLTLTLSALPLPALASPWDPPKVITRHIQVTPVNYWWFREPSTRGDWDYFSPVSQPQEPVLMPKRYKLVYNSGYPFNGIQGFVDSPVFVRNGETRPSR